MEKPKLTFRVVDSLEESYNLFRAYHNKPCTCEMVIKNVSHTSEHSILRLLYLSDAEGSESEVLRVPSPSHEMTVVFALPSLGFLCLDLILVNDYGINVPHRHISLANQETIRLHLEIHQDSAIIE